MKKVAGKKVVVGDSKDDHDDYTVCRDVFLKLDDHLFTTRKKDKIFFACANLPVEKLKKRELNKEGIL